ncbi:MAG TPA: transcriptional regulator [Pyrinomonadaceae bacterium]|nr:transcriptional regulator [Pyrinomonadaceae bacterium]
MPHSNLSYEFGPYRLNPGERVLSRDGETISLAPKAADILTMLVVRAGELVPKDELLKQVWPNTFIEEANLTQNIFLLRKVLGQKHTGPKYIETVTRRGYRFVADVKVVGGVEQRAPESKGISEAAVPPESLHRPVVAVLPFINTSRDEGLGVPGRLIPVRCYHDLATTLKELSISEQEPKYSDEAKVYFMRALYETEAIGHHRAAAALENNLGLLFLSLGSFAESEQHVLRSRRLFESLSDTIRWAQCNETLAKLYIEMKRFSLAEEAIRRAIEVFEVIDGEALLSEALTTQGLLLCKLDRFGAAKKSLEAGYRVAERCGDNESTGRALLILIEEMGDQIEQTEKIYLTEKLRKLFASTQQTALLARVEKCIANVPQET